MQQTTVVHIERSMVDTHVPAQNYPYNRSRRNIGSNHPPLRFATCSTAITAILKQCKVKHYFSVGRISGEDFMAASCL